MTPDLRDDPFALLARDLGDLKNDALGIGTLAREIAGTIEAQQRAARERLHATVAAATLFATLSATLAAIALGHTGAGALVIGIVAGLAAASSGLLTRPVPVSPRTGIARPTPWWRR